jgi:uncharacterized protein YyaL (SSP411 family)
MVSFAQTAPQVYTNHLLNEKSPYLQQHADNPVDWYPWGEEAFAKARREQKPILLSIGYSTCHWCHVMERESFSDPAIAEILNRYFVSVKVDREERPDVDRVYLAFLQLTIGTTGYPMTIFLAPDLKPILGGTYFPREDSFGLPAFRGVLQKVADAWENDRENMLLSANSVTGALQDYVKQQGSGSGTPGRGALDKTHAQLQAQYDKVNGGFSDKPKFPQPVVLNFLLRYYARTGQQSPLDMTLHTLRTMAQSGLHDHLGGGFFRYSPDSAWRVPHFEKMLYDQAQIAVSYLEAYQITRDRFFADVARSTLEYVLREMHSAEGGFHSAQDADSLYEHGKPEHGEGAFYVWKAEQIESVLGSDAGAFNFHYGVDAAGNVPAEHDIQGELKGFNVLRASHTVAETATRFRKSQREIQNLLAAGRAKLFAARGLRPRPPHDDKVLTAWNGLMISAFARAAQVLDNPSYADVAVQAAGFLKSHVYDSAQGVLKRRYRAGDAGVEGFLEDYAFLIQGLLDLYETSFDVQWLTWAVNLQQKQDQLFWDSQQGAYFATTGNDASILLRMRDEYDGAEPSANSIAAMNLLRLWQMTDRDDWKAKADKTFTAFSSLIEESPEILPQLVAALDFSLSKPKQIIIAGRPGAADTRAMLRLVHERYIPHKFLILADGGAGQRQIARWLPFVDAIRQRDGKATAYICENYVCKLPTADLQVAARLLDEKIPE